MPWYTVDNVDDLSSPALLVYPDRIRENTRRMIDRAQGVSRLWPHVKTHKMPAVVRMQLAAGLTRFKCSTIAEAEMTAQCGASAILLGYPQVGPNVLRFARLVQAFPQTRFLTVADNQATLHALSAAIAPTDCLVEVLVDLDTGMHRSGIAPGEEAAALYQAIEMLPGLAPGGLHVYDGHVRDRELADRIAHGREQLVPARKLRAQLLADGRPVPRMVVGGTPSFPVHALAPDLELSPGTCALWDINYSSKFPDLDFLWAAVLLGRVVSKPGQSRLCMDLGYKAVSPDNAELRVQLLNVDGARVANHSEEHLTVETPSAEEFAVGDAVYGIPFHVCPTVALHREAVVIEARCAVDRWPIVARDRRLTF